MQTGDMEQFKEQQDKQDDEIQKLWDAHGRLKEEQIRLREHMSARFDEQDRNMDRLRDELRREIQTGDANNARRHNELRQEIRDTLTGLAASNPVWVTFVVTIVVAGLGALVTWLVVK